MTRITSIATSLPPHEHAQDALFQFADKVYSKDEGDSRKLKFLYRHSGIDKRYSVVNDFTTSERAFFMTDKEMMTYPSVETRMEWFNKWAPILSVNAIEKCIEGKISPAEITHLITVSCTGMSAPGLDLQVMEAMQLPNHIVRTSVNFMGCYAAVHALKLANAFCLSEPNAKVMIICTELCTIHFQETPTPDNLTSSLLFGDGAAAVLVENETSRKGLEIKSFFSDVSFKGKQEMAWEISSKGFLMTLTGYIPELIREDFQTLTEKALKHAGLEKSQVTDWCIHPGGKKILEAISASLELPPDALSCSYEVLKEYGNMSSPTILFVLEKIWENIKSEDRSATIFGAAFGPGLTMETFICTYA